MQENNQVLERLLRALTNHRVSHAYLIEGENAAEKEETAKKFVQALLCLEQKGSACEQCLSCQKIAHGNHEDFLFLQAEGTRIKDEMIEGLQGELAQKSYGGNYRAVIIADADTMTVRAQNRLLKTLEEPFSGTVIILLAENLESLIPTIRSRCIIYRLLSQQGSGETAPLEELAIQVGGLLLARGPFFMISKKMTGVLGDRGNASAFLALLERWFRDLLISAYDAEHRLPMQFHGSALAVKHKEIYSAEEISRIVFLIEETKQELDRNANVGYTIKNMILKITVPESLV